MAPASCFTSPPSANRPGGRRWRSPHCAAAIAFAARRSRFGFPSALAFAARAAGFAAATLHTAWIAHPVLRRATWNVAVTGFVESREERERNDRIVVHAHAIEGRRLDPVPQRVRVTVRTGTAPAVGSFVAFKADLLPPLAPLRPGGYDFARDMYFSRIGASGYVLGRIKSEAPPVKPGAWLRYAAAVEGMRDAIDKRIRAVIPGDEGAIASALITGKRGTVTPAVKDAFYVSSLAHVLAIAGFHMAVVTGLVFFFVRGGLALIPSLASRRPIKKWAAAGALAAATFYLVLSGTGVATQRAFVMVAVVLVGVLLDRPALTFRTLSFAALAILTLAPQALLTPSFQMSFAATLALIAAYQYGLPWHAKADTAFGARMALWGGREFAAIAFTSLVAGLATTPYAAYNFYRLAPYGVLANLLAMPVVSAWIMPMGVLGVLTLPLGFDAVFWRLMGEGIDWIIAVVLWVAQLPGAVGRIHSLRCRPAVVGQRRPAAAVPVAHTPALEWRARRGCRNPVGGDDAAARSVGVGRRPDRGATRRRRAARRAACGPRRLRGRGLARRRCRRPRCPRSQSRAGNFLRPVRLHRQARRRRPRRLCGRARCLRGRLPARGAHRRGA